MLNLLERIAFRLTRDDPTFEAIRTNATAFRFVARILNGLNIRAWQISVAGVLLTLLSLLLMVSHISLAIGLIALGVLCDWIDGIVARLYEQPKPLGLSGDVIDTVCDLIRVLAVLIGLVVSGYMPPSWILLLGTVCLIANSLLNGWKNSRVLGRVLSLYNQTVIVGGGIVAMIIDTRKLNPSTWKLIESIVLGVLVVLLFHSMVIMARLRRIPRHDIQ